MILAGQVRHLRIQNDMAVFMHRDGTMQRSVSDVDAMHPETGRVA